MSSVSDAETQVEAHLKKMTLEEKINQLCCVQFSDDPSHDCDTITAAGVGSVSGLMFPRLDANLDELGRLMDRIETIQRHLVENTRLGIPALFHCEAVNGGVFAEASCFPSAIAQASSWDPELVKVMAAQIGEQVFVAGFRHVLSPVFDIARDPRWGRLTETYGEDETLAAVMAVAYVQGLQESGKSKRLAATGKHFVGHGVTEGGLNMSQNQITDRELLEVHCKPFQAAITEADLMGVMNSYCAMNREPIVGSKSILTKLLRDELGFQGILVSDYLAINRLIDPYQTAATPVDAGVQALKAGIDIEFPAPFGYTPALSDEVDRGRITIDEIDRSVRRVLRLKFDLGLFNNPYPIRTGREEVFHTDYNKGTALRLAQESMTLLKNENGLLPLSRESRRIAVIGPHANTVRSYFASYTYPALMDMSADTPNNEIDSWGGTVLKQRYPGDFRETPPFVENLIRGAYPECLTLAEAIQEMAPNAMVNNALGISFSGTDVQDTTRAIDIAANSDVVILTLGGRNAWGLVGTIGEGVDNSNIDLPGRQEDFARAVYDLKKKTIVVHFDGKPLCNRFVVSHFDALIEAWQPGEAGGRALASVIFGDYNPSGRLPLTAASGVAHIPSYYGLPRGSGYASAGRFGIVSNQFGYANDSSLPIFYFGHGLSYSQFEYSNMQVSPKRIAPNQEISVTVDVTNAGRFAGDEVVQLYCSDILSSMVRPRQQLLGFRRISIEVNETKAVTFKFDPSLLSFLDAEMRWKIEAGEFELQLGSSSVDIRLTDKIVILSDETIDPKTRCFYSRATVS